ncbi:hypothetical protein FF36_01929 [Frankia torreyi]|uniref:LysM domain-containing protein n=1 Tax=Frankia torreyi TaxID=1856 RepID=A0A0D8BID1_9ACTN|nr:MULTISPECIES: hypothetical protein [Frankia]KJE23744.1 hypothetical protein FF36_01929 [Frankia torreyi]
MIAGAARRTLALFAGAAGAAGTAIILIVFGPRLADLPAGVGDVPDWFTAAPEQALVTVVGAVAWLCLLWLCLGVLLGVAAAIPGGVGRLSAALARLILPRAMRRMIEIGLGVTLVAGVAPVMAAMPAAAAGSHPATGIGVTAPATFPDLGRPATVGLGDAGVPASGHATGLPSLDRPAATAPDAAATDTAPTGAAGARSAAPGPRLQGVTYHGEAARPAPASPGAVGLPDLDRPDLDRPAPATPRLPDLGRPASATPATTADEGASPTISVPGLGEAIPVVDLHATAPASTSSTPPHSPDAAQSGAPAAPDPGPPVRLIAARTSVSWPDLERPATDPPRTAAPSTAPTGPAPAGGASAAPARQPASSAPARDPLVPSSHRGTGVPASPSGTGQSARAGEAEEVVVLRGDNLWTIAARHLGPTATHEQIAAEWPRWWAANSDVIGHDPNLILPGQRLKPPSGP